MQHEPYPSTHNQTSVAHVLSCAVVLTDDVEHKNIRTSDVIILLWCDLVQVLCFCILILCKLMRSLDRRIRNKNHRTCCCKTVIICSCVAILLIRFMKPNVFELHAPISKVATLGCQWSHTAALLFCWYGLWNQMRLNCVPLAAN